MTTTHAAAQAELTHAGREVSQEESDRWLKGTAFITEFRAGANLPRPGGFDPTKPVSPLAARLLAASNAIDFGKDRP